MDNLRFGAAMAGRGHVPKDKLAAAGMGARLARQRLGRRAPAPPPAIPPDAETLPFYAGCALPQDHELLALVHEVAAGFGVRLEQSDAGCCGHPSRGEVAGPLKPGTRTYTVCPACDASLTHSGVEAVPLWDALTERARRRGQAMAAAAPAFVPYVGCLAERGPALEALTAAGDQAGAVTTLAYPSLHNGCCGALGGVYRGATKASAMLLEFAAGRGAPVVTSCVLCRDNLRSAARELDTAVPIHFWPEFFRAVPEAEADD